MENTYTYNDYLVCIQLLDNSIFFNIQDTIFYIYYEDNLDIKYFSSKYTINETYTMLKGVFEKKNKHKAEIIKSSGYIKLNINIDFEYFIIEFKFNIKQIDGNKKLFLEKSICLEEIIQLKSEKTVLQKIIEKKEEENLILQKTIKKFENEKLELQKIISKDNTLKNICKTRYPEIIIDKTKLKCINNQERKPTLDVIIEKCNLIEKSSWCIYTEYNKSSNIIVFSNGFIYTEYICGEDYRCQYKPLFTQSYHKIGIDENIEYNIKLLSHLFGLIFGKKELYGIFAFDGFISKYNGNSYVHQHFCNNLIENLLSNNVFNK
jgi:hypothetical protein